MFYLFYLMTIIVFCIGCDSSPTTINAAASIDLSESGEATSESGEAMTKSGVVISESGVVISKSGEAVTKSGVAISIKDGTVPATTGPKENRVIPPVPDVNTTRPAPAQMNPIAPVVIPPKDDFKILLPIEIMTDNIATLPERKIVFTLTKAQATAIKTMDITFHGLSYQSKASVKFNSGLEQDINEKNTRIKLKGSVKSLGGINGGYSVVPMDIQVNPGELVEGSNTVTFRMINRRSSATGFRVLYFNFTLDDNTDLFPQTAYEESSSANDPVQWPPVSTDSSIIENGKNLWLGLGGKNRRPLKSLEGKVMKASCADCHLKNGWDLKYFNYSSMTISARSMAHGLTKDEGSAIASYINSLNIQPYGRPWNPVYQPGPGLESKPIEQWAAGAGAAWVLGKDSYTSLFLYPKTRAAKAAWQPEQLNGGIKTPDSKNLSIKSYNFTLKDLAARTEVINPVIPEQFGKNGYLNTIDTPVAIQLPDWNDWLPRIWPGDLDDNFIPGDNPAIRPLFRRNSGDPSKNIADLFLDKNGANESFNTVYSTLAGMSLPDRMQFIKNKMSPRIHEGIRWPELSTALETGDIDQYMPAHGAVVDPDTMMAGKEPQYFGQSVTGSGNCDALFKDKNTSQQIAIYKSSSPNRQFNISRFCNLGANDPLYPNNRKIAYKDFDNYETALDSVNKWGIVRAFELHHVFSLLNLGQYLDPEQQKLPPNGNFNSRRWIFGRPFAISPHMIKLSWENIGADYMRKEAYALRSDQWYYSQTILNPSDNRRARGKESPVDWGYMYGFMDTAGQDFSSDTPREIAPSMMRFLISSQKKMQSSYPTAPRGEFYEGWTMDKMFDGWHLSTDDHRNFYFLADLTKFIPKNVGRPEGSFAEALNDASSPEAKVFVNNLIMHNYQSWFDETKNHKPKEFFTGYVDSDGKEQYIGRGAGVCNNKEPDAEFDFAPCDQINSGMTPQEIAALTTPPVIEPSQVLIYDKKYTEPYFFRKNSAETLAGTIVLARAQGVTSPTLDQMVCYLSYVAPNPANLPILKSLMSDKRIPKWDIANQKCK